MGWIEEISPGDIVLFNLPQENPTFFGRIVHYFQKALNRKTHAAVVVDAGDVKPKMGEMALMVVDIEFGRQASTYFIPRKYGDIDIYRLFNSQLSCTLADGSAKIAYSEDISKRAAQIALNYRGASYSVSECLTALDLHKKNQSHLIDEAYMIWLNSLNKDSPFMCVSFVLTCYQQACIELLGGLPPAFKINARTTPSDFAEHIENSSDFCCRPRKLVYELLTTGDPLYRRTPSHSRFSWLWSRWDPEGYQPLIASSPYEDSFDGSSHHSQEDEDDGAGVRPSPTVQ